MAAAINTNLSTLLTNTYGTNPPVQNPSGLDGAVAYHRQSTVAIPTTATDLAGSLYKFNTVSSSDIVIAVKFSSTALTAGAISLGLYKANTSTVAATNSDHLFATSINCASAVVNTDERYTNLTTDTLGQRVWQLLGLASDPLVTYDLVGTSTTGATAAGTLSMEYVFTR